MQHFLPTQLTFMSSMSHIFRLQLYALIKFCSVTVVYKLLSSVTQIDKLHNLRIKFFLKDKHYEKIISL